MHNTISWQSDKELFSVDNVGSDTAPSTAILRATTAITNTPVDELPPLTESVNPDALDGFFEDRASQTPPRDGRVAFRYAGFKVQFTGDETLSLKPIDEQRKKADFARNQ